MKYLLILLWFVCSYSFAGGIEQDLNEPNTKVDCKTTTTCKEVVPKNIKIVYRDKVKIVYRDKIVYREKPIETEKEKIVYKDKIVYRDVYKSCAEQRAGKLDFDLIAGMGKNGFFTELDEENDEYTMRRAWGAVGGLRAAYRFDNSVTLGLGAISNETFFLTLGTSFFK